MAPKLRKGSERRLFKKSGKKSSEEMLKRCERMLMDPDRMAWPTAQRFLEEMKVPEKKRLLIKCLTHEDVKVRGWAVKQLNELREEMDIDDFLDITDYLRIKHPGIRVSTVQALGLVNGTPHSGLISELLMDHLGEEENGCVLKETVAALWNIEIRKTKNYSFTELVMLLENENDLVRETTLKQIKKNKGRFTDNDIKQIGNILSNEDSEIRYLVVEALDAINNPPLSAHGLIWQLEEEKDPKIVIRIIDALKYMRNFDDVNNTLHSLLDNPRFSEHWEYIDDILEDTVPVDIPMEHAAKASVKRLLLDERIQYKMENLSMEIKRLNRFKA